MLEMLSFEECRSEALRGSRQLMERIMVPVVGGCGL